MERVIEEIRNNDDSIRPYLTDEPPKLETNALPPVSPVRLSIF